MIAIPASHSQAVRHIETSFPAGITIRNGFLMYHDIDLMSLIEHPLHVRGHIESAVTPMYVRHLPTLRTNYRNLHQWFAQAKATTGFPGDLTVAFASKANPAEPVVRTLMREGAPYECSSTFDVDVVREAEAAGWLDKKRLIISNGFKIPVYTQNLLRLRAEGFTNVLPIFEDIGEIEPFAESGLTFEVGLRSRTHSSGINRFGMGIEDLEIAAEKIQAASNLHLTTFHAMQTVSAARGLQYHAALASSLRMYAHLWRLAPSLCQFDLGGGLPGASSGMNFQDWMNQTLQLMIAICGEENVPVPNLMIESGRYLVQNHACKMFRIVRTKMAEDDVPFYLIDGSIMTNFPDAWALGDAFTVLPVNNWNSSFGPARLCGLTCDPDDVYPTRKMGESFLEMPIDPEGLIVGFFDCGAYQETLGGRHGTKHCLLPEGPEVVFDENAEGHVSAICEYERPQTVSNILGNLGYHNV